MPTCTCFLDVSQILTILRLFFETVILRVRSNVHCSETYSNHCQISKKDCFEKVVDGFELLTIH